MSDRRLTSYADGLIDQSVRLVGAYKGNLWVSDRYVMVRADMFKRPVTRKGVGFLSLDLQPKIMRRMLSGIPREFYRSHRVVDLTLNETNGRTLRFVSSGTALTAFDARVMPLIEACDHVVVHANGSRIAGFQKRPRSAQPVLVCIVMGVRFVTGDFTEVTR